MEVKKHSHKCEACGRGFTPWKDNASDKFGPECAKRMLLTKIEDLDSVRVLVSPEQIKTDKTFFNYDKQVIAVIDSSVQLETALNSDSDELDFMIAQDLKESANKVFELHKKLSNENLTAGELIRTIQKSYSEKDDTLSDFASAIFVHKFSSLMSSTILIALPDSTKLMLAKNTKTNPGVLMSLGNDESNSKIQQYAKMTIQVQKGMKNGKQ